jgi:hypothetical protein
MCPLCIATGSLLLASAGSAGGLTAVTAKVLRTRRANRKRSPAAGSLAVTASAAARPDFPHPSSELASE